MSKIDLTVRITLQPVDLDCSKLIPIGTYKYGRRKLGRTLNLALKTYKDNGELLVIIED